MLNLWIFRDFASVKYNFNIICDNEDKRVQPTARRQAGEGRVAGRGVQGHNSIEKKLFEFLPEK